MPLASANFRIAREAVAAYRAHPSWNPTEAHHAEQILRGALLALGRDEEARAEYERGLQLERQRSGKP